MAGRGGGGESLVELKELFGEYSEDESLPMLAVSYDVELSISV